jgi:hypothetical protein
MVTKLAGSRVREDFRARLGLYCIYWWGGMSWWLGKLSYPAAQRNGVIRTSRMILEVLRQETSEHVSTVWLTLTPFAEIASLIKQNNS